MVFLQPPDATHLLGFVTLFLASALLLLGLLSLAFVLRFRFKAQRSRFLALRDFNSLWPVRIILVGSSFLWALSELFRLPLLRQRGWLFYRLGSSQQAGLCRLHVAASLGLAEPCFFLAAVSLLRGSMQAGKGSGRWAAFLTMASCLPALALHSFVAFGLPQLRRPRYLDHFFVESFGRPRHGGGTTGVWCSFPLLSTIITAASGIAFVPYFLSLSWRMMDMVINRRLGVRVYGLSLTVLISPAVHVCAMGVSVFWKGQDVEFQILAFLSFLSVCVCSAVAQIILVIMPIADSLAVDSLIPADDGTEKKPPHACVLHMGSLSPEDEDEDDGEELLLGPTQG
ncbi:uncharacterized protein LOC116259948 [Nymphaea colorata]|uniref:uncharacterized protein LOC116259948 n=1 Tax=Nymphaea colorata TaxID=210225 RepID=UPI00129E8242|nr:uncharacterized protein LOC116259948 [Nymphaea colorata]